MNKSNVYFVQLLDYAYLWKPYEKFIHSSNINFLKLKYECNKTILSDKDYILHDYAIKYTNSKIVILERLLNVYTLHGPNERIFKVYGMDKDYIHESYKAIKNTRDIFDSHNYIVHNCRKKL